MVKPVSQLEIEKAKPQTAYNLRIRFEQTPENIKKGEILLKNINRV